VECNGMLEHVAWMDQGIDFMYCFSCCCAMLSTQCKLLMLLVLPGRHLTTSITNAEYHPVLGESCNTSVRSIGPGRLAV